MIVGYKKRFVKIFKNLPPSIREQFKDRLRLFRQDKFHPILNNHSVKRVFSDCRSINVNGDYRAIFKEVEEGVIFVAIGRHSELYQ